MPPTLDIPREIESLALALNAPLLPNWAAAVDHFAAAAGRYTEYQITLASGELALVTLGKGAEHLAAISAFMDGLALPSTTRDTFTSMRRYAGEATWGVKVALTHAPELQVYVKRPLPLPEVLFWLGRQGVDAAAQAHIAATGRLLDKTYTHFLGADFSPDRPAAFQVYFTQYSEADGAAGVRLQQALAELDLDETARASFAAYHPMLAGVDQTVWLSLSLVDGRLLPSVKLDYSGVRLGAAALVLEDLLARGAAAAAGLETALNTLTLLRDTLGIPQASYFGLRLGGGDVRASVYLTRLSRSGY